jgi:hypothetical protein
MNCHEFWEQGSGSGDHLKECAACAARYSRLQQLGMGMRALGAASRHVEAPARVERRLVAALRAQMGQSAPRRAWLPVMVWGTALAATVLAGFVLLQGHQPQRTHRMAPATVDVASLAAADVAETAGIADGYEDFIPLPDAESIAPNEQVNLVRVAVPRSAMIPLGYAVSEEHASEIVEADVMLGADGLARAVRFPNEATNF